ncbi:MAG TPA: sulfite exporter TauE/SafE family protein [Candidatus Hydrogenedentes bacterium]|nr:sulfite exporter TauE/SafE family protein [Candidatus Hydrogenedentota bacterium]
MTGIIIGSFAAFTAGLAQSCLGFGMALIMAPCIMLIIEPRAVVPTVLLMSITNTFLIALKSHPHIKWRLLLPLSAGGLVGFSFGLRALLMLDSDNARLVIGMLVLIFTAVLWSGWRWPLPETPWMLTPVGMLSGFTGGATSISGPPVVLFLANQNTPRDTFRANLVCYFFIINCYGIIRV